MSTDVPAGGPPAEPTDPTASVDQSPGQPAPGDTPVPAVDVSGQTAPSPDSVGVPEGQGAVTMDPNAPGTFPPDTTTAPTTAPDAAPADAAPTDTTTPAAPAEVVTSPPADTTDLPAWAENETADPGVIRAIELGNAPDRPEEVVADTTLPEGNEAVVQASDTYVSINDPELGPQITRWLEGRAARDARLSPLVERLGFLPNVWLKFASDDPVLARAEEPTAA